MTTTAARPTRPARTPDQTELDAVLGGFVTDLGGFMSGANIAIGDRLGLYRALADDGPFTAAELAAATGTAERYVREWLRGQAASAVVTWHADGDRYSMSDAQALAYADVDGLSLPGAFDMAVACVTDLPLVLSAFRTGTGVAWGDHSAGVFTGCERFYRPGYVANLLASWIPAIDGLDERLRSGISVADVGCGLGSTTRIIAEAYAASTVVGYDNHPRSIELARALAAEAGLEERVRFEVAASDAFPGSDVGMVATFDCLHDMGDPLAAGRHIREALAEDGVWMIVEPYAADEQAENLTPVGRLYAGFSTFLCVPHAISEGSADALGNQAGARRILDVVEQAGFGSAAVVATTPFNLVMAARP